MGFKEVASLDADVTIAIGKKDKAGKAYPKQAEGYYLGSRTVENKRGTGKLHFLQTAKGNLGVWGTTDLNRKLESVPAGTMVRITFTGMKDTPNGEMYVYKVEQDTDNVIEVQLANNEASYAADDEDNGSSEEAEGYADEEQESEDAVTAPNGLTAAQRQAQVQALLKGNKSRTKN